MLNSSGVVIVHPGRRPGQSCAPVRFSTHRSSEMRHETRSSSAGHDGMHGWLVIRAMIEPWAPGIIRMRRALAPMGSSAEELAACSLLLHKCLGGDAHSACMQRAACRSLGGGGQRRAEATHARPSPLSRLVGAGRTSKKEVALSHSPRLPGQFTTCHSINQDIASRLGGNKTGRTPEPR